MEFRTFDQAMREPYTKEYRHSIVMALAGFVAVLAAMIGGGLFTYRIASENMLPALFIGACMGLLGLVFALLTWGMFRGRMHPSNWLVRTHMSGISIKFRSYLNRHFDGRDAVVVFLRYSEIEYARPHRLVQDVPGASRGEIETRYLRFAEFKLRNEDDLERLDKELATERSRNGPQIGRFIKRKTTNRDYPVEVSDGFLWVQWQVWPRLPRFMQDISEQIAIHEAIKTRNKYRELKGSGAR
jgi:hypothetical protein